jgi:hypothetical protein
MGHRITQQGINTCPSADPRKLSCPIVKTMADEAQAEQPKGLAGEGSTDEEISAEDQAAIAAAMAEEGAAQAKSLKCVDCGKLFKNADLANYHAEKSGHENFEESTEEVVP